MKKIKKAKKIILYLAIVFEIAALNAYPAFAISIPSPSDVASQLESRYHISASSVQNMAESFNTSGDKLPAPEVSLSFSPNDPKLGEKITATATPMYFGNNSPNSLYYTWYLKHPDCKETTKQNDPNYSSKCDLNNDELVNVEDWKIEAARIITDGSYDYNEALGSSSSNCGGSNPPDYCSHANRYTDSSISDNNAGYKAISGGDDKQGMNRHCYIHDFTTGIDYELVNGNVAGSQIVCEDLGDGITRNPVCVRTQENVSPGSSSFNSSYACKKTADDPTCSITSSTNANFSCPSPDEIPMCVADSNIDSNGTVFRCVDGSGNTIPCDFSGTPTTASDSCESLDTDNTEWPKGNSYPFDQVSCGSTTTTLNSDVSFLCDDTNKRHLFPYPPFESLHQSGDGTFTRQEESFWRTNPQSSSTANNNNKDEANVVGLGQTAFAWNYTPGDQVGVAVEGVSSTPTKYNDSSMMIEWALPKNKCDIADKGTYTKSIKGYSVNIPIANIAENQGDSKYPDCIDGNCLNNCLARNLVDPRGDQNSLAVSLSYSPESPLNDSSVSNSGDELDVNASVTGAKNNNYLNYQWQVYKTNNTDINTDNWIPMLKSDLFPDGSGQTSGIGLSTLKFKLNFLNPPKYLKAKVSVAENIDATTTNTGDSDVIIPITSTANKIHVYSTSADNNLTLSLGDERCNTGMDNVVCPVVKNEIVGLKVDSSDTMTNILWTLDGQPIQPIGQNCVSGDCDPATGKATNMAYFPILKENGDQYSIGLTANTSTGNINLTKTFQVGDPSVSLISGDNNSCQAVLLGNYVDLNNQQWPDYSDTSFQAVTGQTINLKPVLNMPFATNQQWSLDGMLVTSDNASSLGATLNSDGSLSFKGDKQAGDAYSVAFSAIYEQNNNIKKILNSSYGVQLNEFYEIPISASINIAMVDSLGVSGTAQNSAGHKILASLATDVPAYISFLFKIVLTVFLILFASRILLALYPETKTNEE